jgi:hypothetical protein
VISTENFRVISLTSQATCRAFCSIARLYPVGRTPLSANDPDIFNAYHKTGLKRCSKRLFGLYRELESESQNGNLVKMFFGYFVECLATCAAVESSRQALPL